jgi:WD40 repeat protein
LASSSYDQKVKLWSLESQKKATTFQGHSDYATFVAFSPDGKYLASGSEEKTAKPWNMENFQEI